MICASLILGVHLASHHLEQYDYQNNTNPGVYAECDGWTAGMYLNTLKKTSVYAGYTFKAGPLGLSVGGVTGYRKYYELVPCPPAEGAAVCAWQRGASSSAVAPMVVPHLTLGSVRLWYLPRLVEGSSAVFHVSIQKEF